MADDVQVPAGPDIKTAEEALERLLPSIESVPDEIVQVMRVPAIEVVAMAQALYGRAKEDAPLMTERLKEPPLAQIDLLPQAALAMWALQVRYDAVRDIKEESEVKKLLREGKELRDLFADGARYLWLDDPRLGGLVKKILAGRGYRDMAEDVPAYLNLFETNWADAENNCRIKENHLQRAKELSPQLIACFSPEAPESDRQRALILRDRAWTLLQTTYNEVIKAGAYIHDKKTAEERYPSLVGSARELKAANAPPKKKAPVVVEEPKKETSGIKW